MLNKDQEKQIKDAIYEVRRNGNGTDIDMMFAAIKAYDEIINPPSDDDTNWEKFMAYSHQEKTFFQKVIDFLKS